MKKVILFFFTAQFFHFSALSQSLIADMKYVFIDSEDIGQYNGGINIKSGKISLGDILSPKDETGMDFPFKVIEIEDYELNTKVKTLTSGKQGFIILETLDKKKLVKNPTGSLRFGTSDNLQKNVEKTNTIGTNCIMDDYVWEGNNYFKSSSYFPKGNHLINSTKPYLILSFKAAQSPDDRQITLIHKDTKIGVGVLDKMNYELVLSGSKDGIHENACLISNWKDGAANTEKTDFYFEIKKFEDKGDHIILSAKYSGKLFGLNLFKGLIGSSCKDVVIKDGTINNLKVEKL